MIATCLDISAQHVSHSTMELLFNSSVENRAHDGWPAMTVAPYEAGVFMTVPEREYLGTRDALKRMPEDLHTLLSAARLIGVNLLRLDEGGSIYPHLPLYDW